MTLSTWYPHYIGDYNRKTSHLTMTQHGAYRLLLDHYYATDGNLPDDNKQLFRICRAFDEQEQEAIAIVLQLFFERDAKAKKWTHKRADEELQKKAEISEKRSQAAKNKGKSRKANAKQMQSNCTAKAHTTTSTSTSTITSTKNNPPLVPPKGKGKRLDVFMRCDFPEHPDKLPQEWGEYAEEQGMMGTQILREWEKFYNYWTATAGAKGVKRDWKATWRNWIINTMERS